MKLLYRCLILIIVGSLLLFLNHYLSYSRISAKRISDGKSLRNLKIKIPSEISHYWLLGEELPDVDKKPEESHFILLIVPTKRFYIFF